MTTRTATSTLKVLAAAMILAVASGCSTTGQIEEAQANASEAQRVAQAAQQAAQEARTAAQQALAAAQAAQRAAEAAQRCCEQLGERVDRQFEDLQRK